MSPKHQALGQLDESRDLLEKAYASLLSRLGPDHPTTRKIKRNLDSLASGTSA